MARQRASGRGRIKRFFLLLALAVSLLWVTVQPSPEAVVSMLAMLVAVLSDER
jgi:hypothetical protein